MSRPQYIILYLDDLEALEPLGDAERGRLLTALLKYGRTGAVEKLDGNERFLFPMLRTRIDRDFQAYEDKCLKNKSNRSKGTTVNDRRPSSTTVNGGDQEKEKEEAEEEAEAKAEEKDILHTPHKGAVAAYLDRVNPAASQTAMTELAAFERDMGVEVCILAMDRALDDKKGTWSYIRAILRNWKSAGVKCVADVATMDARRTSSKISKAPSPAYGSQGEADRRAKDDMERMRRIMQEGKP